MKKLLFLCWSLALLLFSCTNAADDALAPTEADGEYVTLTLDTQAATEDKETLRGTEVNLTLDVDGKPRVHFVNAGYESTGTTSVYTIISKGENVVFAEKLDWQIEEGGRRLSYRGPIKIKKELLQVEGDLQIYAHTAADQLRYNYNKGLLSFFLEEGAFTQARIPHIMIASLKQSGKSLHMVDVAQSKFKSFGTLAALKIKNNLPIDLINHGVFLESSSNELSDAVSDEYGFLGLPGTPVSWKSVLNRRGEYEVNPEGFSGSELKSGESKTVYAWVVDDAMKFSHRFAYYGVGVVGYFSKVSGEAGHGKLLQYEVEFKLQKNSLDRGLLMTDNHGNALFDRNTEPVPESSINVSRYTEITVDPYPYFHLHYYQYGYTEDQILAKTTTEDAWLMRYYIPSFPSIASVLWEDYSVNYYNELFSFYRDIQTEAKAWPRGRIVLEPLKSGGFTEDNVFSDERNILRDIVKFERGGPLFEGETKAELVGGSVYMMRFLNDEKHRVFQTIRFLQGDPHNTYYVVEFLPYDAAGVENDRALTPDYWIERANEIQRVYIRLPLTTRNMNPRSLWGHLHTIAVPEPSYSTGPLFPGGNITHLLSGPSAYATGIHDAFRLFTHPLDNHRYVALPWGYYPPRFVR